MMSCQPYYFADSSALHLRYQTTVDFYSRVYEVTNDFSGTGSQTCWSDTTLLPV